jgi:DNA-binding NtrC family response regulator
MAIVPEPQPVSPSARETTRGTLLVVDDDPGVRRAVTRVLHRAGFEVHACADGKSAIDTLASVAVDTVVTDFSLPDITGVDLLRHLRGLDNEVPVILMTGGPAMDTAIQAIESGACQYLMKPLDSNELVTLVEKGVLRNRMRTCSEISPTPSATATAPRSAPT